jgi:hypothetical protein
VETLPVWITVVGAALLVTDRRVGYWLFVTGTVLATMGQGFSYVPFVPWFSWNPLFGLILMHLTNFVVVALVGYSYFREPRPAEVS